MGYYPNDMMSEWLSEDATLFDIETGTWEFEEEEHYEAEKEYILEELSYDPDEKAAEIIKARPQENYIYVFGTGEWFETTEEAFLWKHENELLTKLLKRAYQAGKFHDPGEDFDEFFANYTHGGRA